MALIQYIVVGWHFDNFPDLVEDLINLKKSNSPELLDIFWSCHKEPSDLIKSTFNYKVFPNLGLEDGAYQQALDFLNLDDETILFLIHDDLIVKDWGFFLESIEYLNKGYFFVGNGFNYPARLSRSLLQYVKPENLQFFSNFEEGQIVYTIRESFICTKRKYLKAIGDFEVIWKEPIPDKKGETHIGAIGNIQQTLLGAKISLFHGKDKIKYLSDSYQDSKYLYEVARGKRIS